MFTIAPLEKYIYALMFVKWIQCITFKLVKSNEAGDSSDRPEGGMEKGLHA